ncbi:hypothetical protein [Paenibacillus periandrae]|uniref:hypothetical protein n=1 Tax=Paenibacillus periandrae TaxID=1761741 RepID=UPI001F09829E|nr:hypothetical protein [Paenibacillus periandrae]
MSLRVNRLPKGRHKRAAPMNRPLTLLKGPRPPNPHSRSMRSAARNDKLAHPLRYSGCRCCVVAIASLGPGSAISIMRRPSPHLSNAPNGNVIAISSLRFKSTAI